MFANDMKQKQKQIYSLWFFSFPFQLFLFHVHVQCCKAELSLWSPFEIRHFTYWMKLLSILYIYKFYTFHSRNFVYKYSHVHTMWCKKKWISDKTHIIEFLKESKVHFWSTNQCQKEIFQYETIEVFFTIFSDYLIPDLRSL